MEDIFDSGPPPTTLLYIVEKPRIGLGTANPRYDIHVCVNGYTVAFVKNGEISIDGNLPQAMYIQALRQVLETLSIYWGRGNVLLASAGSGEMGVTLPAVILEVTGAA